MVRFKIAIKVNTNKYVSQQYNDRLFLSLVKGNKGRAICERANEYDTSDEGAL